MVRGLTVSLHGGHVQSLDGTKGLRWKLAHADAEITILSGLGGVFRKLSHPELYSFESQTIVGVQTVSFLGENTQSSESLTPRKVAAQSHNITHHTVVDIFVVS